LTAVGLVVSIVACVIAIFITKVKRNPHGKHFTTILNGGSQLVLSYLHGVKVVFLSNPSGILRSNAKVSTMEL